MVMAASLHTIHPAELIALGGMDGKENNRKDDGVIYKDMPTPKGPIFHPDFMFCGACTECGPADTSTPATILSNHQMEKSGDERLRTQLLLQHHWKSPHHQQVIESLLKPISGVFLVEVNLNDASVGAGDGKRSTVTVSHDALTRDSELLRVLQQGGYPASIVSSSYESTAGPVLEGDEFMGRDEPAPASTEKAVRSCFFVQGICCASELPSIRKIVTPMPGVSSLNINITTRRVYVQHDCTILKASEIADRLTHSGFKAQTLQDGGRTHETPLTSSVGRSTLQSYSVLHPQDVPKIQKALILPGIKRVGVNIADSAVFIEHDVTTITAVEIQQQLASNKITQHYQFSLSQDAQVLLAQKRDMLLQQPRSLMVESTLGVINLTKRHVPIVMKAIQQNYIRAQIRSVHPHVVSHTIKVEHNPDKVEARQISDLLRRYGLESVVITDGGIEKHFLPLRSGNSPEQEEEEEAAKRAMEEWQADTMQLNVVLSGIFWVVALLSAVEGWRKLEYAGLLSVFFGLPPVALKALRTLQRFEFDANCMMVVAAIGALLLGELDEAASVSFLFCISEFLEARATQRARKALAEICELRPEYANMLTGENEVVVVPADQIPVGSLISVRTGDKIAADGIVVEGTTLVDESSLTGESVPARKALNDTVSGGSINIGDSRLIVRTTSTVEDSTVSRLIRLVEEAQANRSPTEKLIDSFARKYTPIVLFAALLMATLPWILGGDGKAWTMNALIIVVIACPCALTISTPVTYAAGLAAAAQRGIVVKGGASLEALGKVKKVVLDKTGTLTEGKFMVLHLDHINDTEYTRQEMLELLALMEGPSSHPLSATLVKAAKNEGIKVPENVKVEDHSILKGEGVTALVDGVRTFVGNRRLFERIGMYDDLGDAYKYRAEEWSTEGGTVGFVGVDGVGIIGSFCMSDSIRPEARKTVQALRGRGIEVLMLTGDSEGAAISVADQVGIPRNLVHSQLLPEDKLHFISSIKHPGSSRSFLSGSPKVMFCGDGVNDGPAISVADVGVSMGEGAALAMEMSDITLMDSNLDKLTYIIELGRKVMITIRENILLSLACKIVVVSLTFLGKMTLLYAIASDVGVMLIVTLNGMKVLPSLGSTAETKYSELSDDSANSSDKLTMGPSMKLNNAEIV
ncbi:hypothetical protein FisN_7Hh274 [Fistulifera solaris]|uniref:HMA domain-containing protein n=1 Tax=Fistulifera solaris TaxID=1519565 RepID=A0A1Z5KT78_FISSO|nr:hypothetical protein FisN_7Hh274 [Fistulifera solaris]|eukprot:GAX29128.1 hypothetical protein FisN_7Hh274 [Fistulifera solaris]